MKAAFGPGTTFSNYKVESLLGRGGMGMVYLARDLSLERPVAVKLIAPELAQDEEFRARFLREPKLAASLDHPNVIPIYEAGEHDGQLYLVMRYVEGSDLRTVLDREGKLSPERTLAILGQVADALDAAHRRALVHRDVKPANVLLDEDDHAYLTDFGITKQIGGASTDTGRLVGTLDYLAPEQIRGDPVDGRTDCYALACVLYECLAGKPPFRRDNEAATMWAHMQDEPPPLRGHARLDAVLRKALAKDRENRYARCGELINAAAAALGLEVPTARPRPRGSHALHRRAPAILVIGGVVLAAAVGLAVLAMTGGDDGDAEPLGNGVAALDPADGSITAFIESDAPPGNVAVGEGGVWVLDNGAKTVSRIDPKTREVTESFDTPGVPSELAVGEGALWVGIAAGRRDANATVRVARMETDNGQVTGTARLRGDEGGFPVAGTPRLAVGEGAVWAVNPDGSVSRIDAKSGRLVTTIETNNLAWTIAAGDGGVWYLGFDGAIGVTEIDTRRNRQGRTIPVGASGLMGVAVGGGSVWAAADQDGVVWRIVPQRPAIQRTVDVGRGATFVAFGDGAAWTGNYVDGTVARIDPRTNKITAKASVGAPQALAAGAGSGWVSVAGETTNGALSKTVCGEVASGAGTPDVLIASDLPLQGPTSADPRAMEGAIRHVIERRGFKAGDYTVGYQSCDVSTPQSGSFEFRKCAANASAYAHAEQLVAVIGPWSSFCGQVQIPITNRAPGGPLAMVSAISTHPGLTRGGPLAQEGRLGKGEPAIYYPTGERSFVRLMAREDLQGVANAMLAKELGLKRVYVLQDPGFKVEQSDPFRRTARRLGIQIAGVANFSDDSNHDRLAERVARSRAQGVFIAGLGSVGGGRAVIALRERLGRRIKIMAADPFLAIADVLAFAGRAAHGLYFSATDVPPRAQPPAGRRFARDIGTFNTPVGGVLPAGQATELLLDAIARSDGTRASVLDELRGAKVEDGILGDFRIDRYGDITPARLAIFRITGATPPDAPVFPQFEGAVFDRVIEVPERLSG
jgi:ABC-type branched-subunit amino acid transport system substrate-binding protein/DNA-binding beta-propeller fold protein YncE